MKESTKIKIAKEIKYNFSRFPKIAILCFIFFLPLFYYINGGFEDFHNLRLIWWLKGDYESRNTIHSIDDQVKILEILNLKNHNYFINSQPFEVEVSGNSREVVYNWNEISEIEDRFYDRCVSEFFNSLLISIVAIPIFFLFFVFFRYLILGTKKSIQWVNENAEKTIN